MVSVFFLLINCRDQYNFVIKKTIYSFLGIQQSPAVGRAIAELIVDSEFRTVDLTRLGFDRLVVNEPMLEQNIV